MYKAGNCISNCNDLYLLCYGNHGLLSVAIIANIALTSINKESVYTAA